MGKGKRLREQKQNAAVKERFDYLKVNWKEWSDAGFYTPDEAVYMPLGIDYFKDFGCGLPNEVQVVISALQEAFDKKFESFEDKDMIIAGIKFVKEWTGTPVMLTALSVFFNWKMWENYGKDLRLTKVYTDLYRYADRIACTTLKGDDLSYYYRVTD